MLCYSDRILRVRFQNGRVVAVGDDRVAARVVIEREGEVVAEGQVLAAAKITKDMPVIVKYDPLP